MLLEFPKRNGVIVSLEVMKIGRVLYNSFYNWWNM